MNVLRVVIAVLLLSIIGVLAAVGCRTSDPPAVESFTQQSATGATMRYPTTSDWTPLPIEAAMELIDRRDDWADFPPLSVPRHPAEKYLKGFTVCLDPGHGMSDGETDPTYKRGPTGVREDDINLRVALLLRRLLADAGVNVIMTREADVLLELRDRVRIANESGADLFISIHHNAVDNPNANYTSVWYHREVDDAAVALDVGKYIAHRLGAAMRTDVGRTSPLLSDQLMYASGFGVLRGLQMPGLLLECSFFSNPAEEQRLRDAGYNLRTAYAIYEGLCEYAYGGRPTQKPLDAIEADGRLDVRMQLDDGLPDWWGKDRNRIMTQTISAVLEGRRATVTYDAARRVATLSFDSPTPGVLRVEFLNMFKHHNQPQRFRVTKTGDGWTITANSPATQP
jgi:N-acetylmuramoyl-L-alanine amidase